MAIVFSIQNYSRGFLPNITLMIHELTMGNQAKFHVVISKNFDTSLPGGVDAGRIVLLYNKPEGLQL